MWLLILIGVLVGLVGLVIGIVFVDEHFRFYTKTTCSVCGKMTGERGNKRYQLRDGFMCQSCAEQLVVNKKDISGAGPKWFSSDTVESIRERHWKREAMGEDAWKQWMTEKQQAFQRDVALAKQEANSTVCCPRCGSTQISANQKGFGVGKAVVGAAVAGPVGLAAGGIGSKKVIVTCLKCGHQWQAGRG